MIRTERIKVDLLRELLENVNLLINESSLNVESLDDRSLWIFGNYFSKKSPRQELALNAKSEKDNKETEI